MGAAIPAALAHRRAGILLHPTSLPGPGAMGTLGRHARHFIDRLKACGVTLWQMLPLGPTHADGSPYQCLSSHAGHPGLIDLELLREDGWLVASEHSLKAAFEGFVRHAGAGERKAFSSFLEEESAWLEDYALFVAIREQQGCRAWLDWPDALRERDEHALRKARVDLHERIDQVRFEQFVFFRQWRALRDYAHAANVLLFGDMPIYVAHDSAEVWARPDLFTVDEHGHAYEVAGVPPDYFSATGQRWGNPLYRWERHEADGFAWWKARFATQLKLFDLVRIDHFRGIEAYWSIPSECETAMNGQWVKAPGDELLTALNEHFGSLPVVAEDLGIITEEVTALRQRHGLPGMRILQFAFDGGADNPYLPHNHTQDSVVYTGTHDNDTTLGWWNGLELVDREHVLSYMGEPVEPMPWALIRLALESVANLVIIPLQDIMELGAEARMNTPGTTEGNWAWRFEWSQWSAAQSEKFGSEVELYGRLVMPDA
ncbi:MAG: 4-alpha-glucanotransferase [Halothiobacillaceae bacterium]|nr:MAG: 4-alpha-glucanotransferase [Halothiobacillaceae bacterium]